MSESELKVITEQAAPPEAVAPPAAAKDAAQPRPAWVRTATSIEWIGQMLASIFWTVSVIFFYGISSGGDVVQLLAALSWFVANIGTLVTAARS